MNRPIAVDRLIEELESELIDSDVEVSKDSRMVIFLNEDDKTGFELNADEAKLALANADTAQRLIDAVDHPSTASLLLKDISLDDDVLSILERSFNAVDES